MTMMRRSISTADASGLAPPRAGFREPSFRLMELLMTCLTCLQQPIRPRPLAPARNFVKVEEHLGAVDQVAEKLLGDAGAALARDRLLELLELFLHQVMDRFASAFERLLSGPAKDQVDRVEAA